MYRIVLVDGATRVPTGLSLSNETSTTASHDPGRSCVGLRGLTLSVTGTKNLGDLRQNAVEHRDAMIIRGNPRARQPNTTEGF